MNAHATITPQSFDANHYTMKLVELKDKIKALDDAHDEVLKPYKALQDKLEGLLLGHLREINAQNISTTFGTVSQLHLKSASIEDGTAFMDYVIQNEAWDLLDRKANKKAVEDFIKSNNSPPPGVKFSDALKLGLRRK
jgi:hypothetical protein